MEAEVDVKVWTTNRGGRWNLANGVNMHITQHVFHGADVATDARLTWPAKDGASTESVKFNIAADAFLNRVAWAVAWETGTSTLWVASSSFGQDQKTAGSIRRVDFSDRRRVTVSPFTGWPETGHPSIACMAALDALLPAKPGGVRRGEYIYSATEIDGSPWARSRAIPIYMHSTDGTVSVGKEQNVRLEDLPAALAANKKRILSAAKRHDQQSDNDHKQKPYAVIYTSTRVPKTLRERLVSICQAADVFASDFVKKAEPVEVRMKKPAVPKTDGIAITLVDSDNSPIDEFRVIAGVPSNVSKGFEKSHDVEVVNWQSHMLRTGNDGNLVWPISRRSYKKMALRIEADGYVPHLTEWIVDGQRPQRLTVKLKEDPGIRGSVMTPGGKRMAHDATVALGSIRRGIRITGTSLPEISLPELTDETTLRDRWHRPVVISADANGQFTLPTEVEPTAVVAIIHSDGALLMRYADWKTSPDVVLKPWARINGRVQWGEEAGAGETVTLNARESAKYGYPNIVFQSDQTTADQKGQFVFERLLPGRVQINCPLSVAGPRKASVHPSTEGRIVVTTTTKGSNAVVIGGSGRTVKGRLTGRNNWDDITFHCHPNAPHFGRSGDAPMWAAWMAHRDSSTGSHFFRKDMKVKPDGTFEVPALLPAYYQIFFKKAGENQYLAIQSFRVKLEDWEAPEDVVDLGEIKARTAE